MRIDSAHGEMSAITVNYAPLVNAITEMQKQSKKTLAELTEVQFRGVVKRVISITPPGHSDSGEVVTHARKYGAAAVRKSIQSLYGSASDAYKELKAVDEPEAKRFWKHLSKGEESEAAIILRNKTGKRLAPWDGGQLHRNFKKGRRFRGVKNPVFYIPKRKPLDQYIKEVQGRVGWLCSGWNYGAAAFGVRPPAWVWKHDGDGWAESEVTEGIIRFMVRNRVSWASAAIMEDRIQWAIDTQANALMRAVRQGLDQAAKQARLPLTV